LSLPQHAVMPRLDAYGQLCEQLTAKEESTKQLQNESLQ